MGNLEFMDIVFGDIESDKACSVMPALIAENATFRLDLSSIGDDTQDGHQWKATRGSVKKKYVINETGEPEPSDDGDIVVSRQRAKHCGSCTVPI